MILARLDDDDDDDDIHDIYNYSGLQSLLQ